MSGSWSGRSPTTQGQPPLQALQAAPAMPRKFQLSQPSLLIALAVFALFMYRGITRFGLDGTGIGWAAGGSLIAVILAFAVAQGVYLAKRRQATGQKAANTAFSVAIIGLGVMSAINGSIQATHAAENREAFDRVKLANESFREQARAEFESTGSIEANPERIQQMIRTMDQGAAQMHGDESVAVKIVADMYREVAPLAAAYLQASNEVVQRGNLEDVDVYRSKPRLNEAIEVWQAAAKAHETVMEKITLFPDDLRQRLLFRGINRNDVDAFLVGFNRGYERPLKTHQMESRLIACNMELLSMLRDRWGYFAVNEHNLVEWVNNDDSIKYNKLIDKSLRLVAQQKELIGQTLGAKTN